MSTYALGIALGLALGACSSTSTPVEKGTAAQATSRPTPSESCGQSPSDWCPSPPGDPCGAHKNQAECRADPACEGMPYQGESVVACMPDGQGFWTNCPAVGCRTRDSLGNSATRLPATK